MTALDPIETGIRPGRLFEVIGLLLIGISFVIYTATWAIVWLPFHLTGSQAGGFLWPIFLAVLFLTLLILIAGIVLSVIAIFTSSQRVVVVRSSVAVVLAVALLVFSIPLLWFGQLF